MLQHTRRSYCLELQYIDVVFSQDQSRKWWSVDENGEAKAEITEEDANDDYISYILPF